MLLLPLKSCVTLLASCTQRPIGADAAIITKFGLKPVSGQLPPPPSGPSGQFRRMSSIIPKPPKSPSQTTDFESFLLKSFDDLPAPPSDHTILPAPPSYFTDDDDGMSTVDRLDTFKRISEIVPKPTVIQRMERDGVNTEKFMKNVLSRLNEELSRLRPALPSVSSLVSDFEDDGHDEVSCLFFFSVEMHVF